jgi:anti-anti-sigma factor
MEISSRKEKDVLIVSVKGRMDAVTVQEFDTQVPAFIAEGATVLLLTLDALEYISSAGLRSILAAAKQLKAKGGEILFAGLKGPVKDVFDISGFDTIFKIFPSEEEALKNR